MITLIEALSFRCLHHVRQELGPFHVLVGPNASGKTTFLEVVSFLGQLVEDGLDAAIEARTRNFVDLLWGRTGDSLQLAIEAALPADLVQPGALHTLIRYELEIGIDTDRNEVGIRQENVLLKTPNRPGLPTARSFPSAYEVPASILEASFAPVRRVAAKTEGGVSVFYPENQYSEESGGRAYTFKLGPHRSTLANLPEDETQFPAATWLKALLMAGITKVVLDNEAMRLASPPGQSDWFTADGSNLPWVIDALDIFDPERLRDWIAHLQTALPDLEGIRTVERADDRHRYLVLRYRGGLEVPSWSASDGTLRLIALTLLAYVPIVERVYLIEEPENGIHPRAVETMYQSLSNVYGAQVLLATHSPIILNLVEPSQLLCFAKASDGSTDIVRGSEHPALRAWKGEVSLATLFGAGVLG